MPTFLKVFFCKNCTVSSTILNTGTDTDFLISPIKTCRELHGITIKSAPDFSSRWASAIRKGTILSNHIFFQIASFSKS
jgi:hypothetical protein